jgi:thiamine biosynthesis lipoprotein
VNTAVDRVSFAALGTTAVVLVADAGALEAAHGACERIVAEVDAACSRFRDDSDLTRVNRGAGDWVAAASTLLDALEVGIDAARTTGGLVDPTVGGAMCDIGYDRDFSEIVQAGPAVALRVRRVPGWQRIELDRSHGRIRIPRGAALDLGATAKAWCADRAARAAAETTGVGVAIGLGGDLAFAGTAPPDGWRVHVTEDHRGSVDGPSGQTISMRGGGIATSGTSLRRWNRGGDAVHHIVDPRRGRPASECWRFVSVAAPSCTTANTASTAAIVLGLDAPEWLAARDLPARLVRTAGDVVYVGGWPSP